MSRRYKVRKQHATPGSTTVTGSADDLDSALQAAWTLARYYEAPVEVVDTRDGLPLAVVHIDWVA